MPQPCPEAKPNFAATPLPANAPDQYLAGSHPRGSAWRRPGFEATGWTTGQAAFGYRYTNPVSVPLNDMRGNYTVVCLRKEFVIDQPDHISELGGNGLAAT